jgi:hypothetical protein
MMMKETKKFPVEFSDGKTRSAQFTWQAIDYLLDHYETMAEAYSYVVALTTGANGISKKSIQALRHFLVAMFITDDPGMTEEKIKELVPYDQLPKFIGVIQVAMEAGSVKAGEDETLRRIRRPPLGLPDLYRNSRTWKE